jgi:ubiquinone/menaquinone biosynthesis C-methylase UbiE
MRRILEPEIMDDREQVAAYAKADFSSSNQMFVDGLIETYPDRLGSILDIGCGPADVPIRILRAVPSAKVTAVDASLPMVEIARQAVQEAGFQDNIDVVLGRLPGITLRDMQFQTIASKDLLHHLADPSIFWEEVVKLATGTTAIYVMDLYRPESREDARNIVESVSGNEPEVLKRDFYNSLLAAFTVDEIQDHLESASLPLNVEKVSERHLLIHGLLLV